MTKIARSLRYDSKPLALAERYGQQVVQHQADSAVAALLLAGPAYRS